MMIFDTTDKYYEEKNNSTDFFIPVAGFYHIN